jgi:hypothetical protein
VGAWSLETQWAHGALRRLPNTCAYDFEVEAGRGAGGATGWPVSEPVTDLLGIYGAVENETFVSFRHHLFALFPICPNTVAGRPTQLAHECAANLQTG